MAPEADDGKTEPQRRGERRTGDRRRTDRRLPVPWWRRPWAFMAYGVALAFALIVGGRAVFGGGSPGLPHDEELVDATPRSTAGPADAGEAPTVTAPEQAYGSVGIERLVLEGDAARGRLVRTRLSCGPASNVALSRSDRAQVDSAIAPLVDEQNRVPAAECKWGEAGATRREDLLLLIPREAAEGFASAPEVTDSFVRRRQIHGDVEWVGRSEVLSLRTVGVLRRVVD
jgi:hypothetical protein